MQPASKVFIICADDNNNILHVQLLFETCYPNVIFVLILSATVVDTVHL